MGQIVVAMLAGVCTKEVGQLQYGYWAISKFQWRGDRRAEEC